MPLGRVGVSKGVVRDTFPVKREREGDGGGRTIDLKKCGARKVMLESSRSVDELRAMGPTYLYLDERRHLVLRRLGCRGGQ